MRRTWLIGGGAWTSAWLSASRISSSSWPLLASTTTRRLTRSSRLQRASIGKGQSVMGRKRPTFRPLSRSSLMAPLASCDGVLHATRRTSASSHR